MSEKILVSFSGGRTSALMAKLLLEKYKREDLIFLFANTGQEHEETLKFIEACDRAWDLGVIWLEAVVHSQDRKATSYRIVNYESATRDVSLFKAMSLKYGLPGPGWLHCTRELKERPIHSYITELTKTKKYRGYKTAIGIRADEIDRVNPDYKKNNFYYPLLDWGVTKKDVLEFWSKADFDLNLEEHLGNCVWCWKKSNRKLRLVARQEPGYMYQATELEKYDNHGSGNEPRKMFRGRLSASEILANVQELDKIEDVIEGSCAESCEPFATGE